jgi:hydroxymethylpyrimidine synthase
MNYTTQLDAAKKRIITEEMNVVAAKEDIEVDLLMSKIASGEVVIPAK